MSRVRPKNSKIEKLIFSYLRKRGIHFQRHYKNAPGTPDIARPSEKKAVFVHSDFWHGWRYPTWAHKLSNEFWRTKINQNRIRDRRKIRQLRSLGWKVSVIWEHSLKRKREATLSRIADFLKG